MTDIQNKFQPDYAISPGEILNEELEFRGMSQQELSLCTGIPLEHILSILKAESTITQETAIKLGKSLNMSVKFWLNLESNYQEILARSALHYGE